jgi:hypothetical protein
MHIKRSHPFQEGSLCTIPILYHMIKNILNEILSVCDSFPDQVRAIPDDQFILKPTNKWSKKEVLGHLIDSAAVNIQRFVRGQIEDSPQIWYDQDRWVSVQSYQNQDTLSLITLWESINRQLVYIAAYIPEKDLERKCMMKDGQLVTLQCLIEDYLSHLLHHVKQILY